MKILALDLGTRTGWAVWLLVAMLLLATLAAYHPAWHGGMVWDDDNHVTRPELRSWQGLYRIWFEIGATVQYYPLLHSAFWLQHKLWGDSTLGYHLVNILLHFLAALMVAIILRRMAIPGAWLAAAIFALHPVHVESVAWITELKNTLSAVFYLSAVMLYLRFDESRRRTLYLGALGLFALAMLSKTVTGTLSAALLVILWWQRGRLSWKHDVLPLVPFLVLGAGGGMITAWWEVQFNRVVGPEFQFTIVERLLIASRAVWFHLWKLFWPTNLTFIYPRWQVDSHAVWPYLFLIAGAALLSTLWAIRSRWRAPLAAFLFFCVTLFPVLGFFNLYTFRYSFAANHYQYLASLGIITLVSAGAVLALDRLGLRPAGKPLAVVLLAILSILTWKQSREYVDAETLYRATLARNPSSWMVHNNLGILKLPGHVEEAIAHFKEALRLKPDYAEAHNNLGHALETQGRIEEALAQYNEALRLMPGLASAHYNLGNALQESGRLEEAVAHAREAVRLKPGLASAHYNLGRAFQQLGSYHEAVAQYREVLKQTPGSAEAHNNLGVALVRLGQLEEAEMQFKEALRYEPGLAEAHGNLGAALEDLGRFEEAPAHLTEAVRLKPDYPIAHNNLGNALQQMGRLDEAVTQYNEALRLMPDYAEAHNNLGAALLRQGRFEEAVAQYKEALRLKPDYADAQANLSRALALLKKINGFHG
jgi:tetratricopeptide (TPR) repeat protein